MTFLLLLLFISVLDNIKNKEQPCLCGRSICFSVCYKQDFGKFYKMKGFLFFFPLAGHLFSRQYSHVLCLY